MAKELHINEEIRAKEVRVIGNDGEQIGIISLKEALAMAEEKKLDLVEIAPEGNPPVCKIIDYGKHCYERSKKEKEARKKQKIVSIKEMKLRPNIEENDFQVKVKNIVRFLKDGDKVKVTIMFRGREIVHKQLGEKLLDKIAVQLADIAAVERKPKTEGKNMIMILAPKE